MPSLADAVLVSTALVSTALTGTALAGPARPLRFDATAYAGISASSRFSAVLRNFTLTIRFLTPRHLQPSRSTGLAFQRMGADVTVTEWESYAGLPRIRGVRFSDDQPSAGVLPRISRALCRYVAGKAKTTAGIPALCVAGRIVVCAGEPAARDVLARFEADQFQAERPGGPPAVGPAGQALAGAVDVLRASGKWETGTYGQALTFLRRPDTRHGVFWLEPPSLPGACHAEGTLVALLAHAGITSPAVLAGTLRTCAGCYLTLRFAREHLGLDLASTAHYPGGFWETTPSDRMLALIRAYSTNRLATLPAYQAAPAQERAQIDGTFRYEGVAAFCSFVARLFPLPDGEPGTAPPAG